MDVEVLVRCSRARSAGDVAGDLEAAGMRVQRVLGRLGVVSGTVAPDGLDALGRVDGVRAVEHDREVRPA